MEEFNLLEEFVEWARAYSYDHEELELKGGEWLLLMWDYRLTIPEGMVSNGMVSLWDMTVSKAVLIFQATGLEGDAEAAEASLAAKEAAKKAARAAKEAAEEAAKAARVTAAEARVAKEAAEEAALLTSLTSKVGADYREFRLHGSRLEWPLPEKNLTAHIWVCSQNPPLTVEDVEAAEEAAIRQSQEIPFKGKRWVSHWKDDCM